MRVRSPRRLMFLLGCLFLIGCGGPQYGQVTGRITVDGKPIKAGMVMFHPEKGQTAVGIIQSDGTYTLTTVRPGDGALVGDHKVTISATTVSGGTLADPTSFEEEVARSGKQGTKWLVPGKVTHLVPESASQVETTRLTATVKSGSNIVNFDFPAEAK